MIPPIQPITNKPTFEKYYKFTTLTSYGKRIQGESPKGYHYDVYVHQDKITGNILNKLYYITKNNHWVKSFLRFYSNNKVCHETRSFAK